MLYYINNTVEQESTHGFSQDGSRSGTFGRAGAGCDAGRMRPQVLINGEKASRWPNWTSPARRPMR
jgi:hypothetical protein